MRRIILFSIGSFFGVGLLFANFSIIDWRGTHFVPIYVDMIHHGVEYLLMPFEWDMPGESWLFGPSLFYGVVFLAGGEVIRYFWVKTNDRQSQ